MYSSSFNNILVGYSCKIHFFNDVVKLGLNRNVNYKSRMLAFAFIVFYKDQCFFFCVGDI